MIKAIIFDLGNVIVKVDKEAQYRRFAAKSGKSIGFIINYFEKSAVRKNFERGKATPQDFYNSIKNDF